jgi:hypothetical protein
MSRPTNTNDTDNDRRAALFRLLDTILDGSPSGDGLLSDVIRLYDNLRPSYSPSPTLEFGGLLLNYQEIHSLVLQQVRSLFLAVQPRRILLVWKKRTALGYMRLLRQALIRQHTCDVICHAIQTRWVSERAVIVVDDPVILGTADHVLCVDAFIGTGNTFARLHECLMARGLPMPLNLVLVDLARVKKDYRPVLTGPYVSVDEDFWIIGFGADCLANGVEHGRGIPFMGYLVPYGTGIRNDIMERYHEQVDRLQAAHRHGQSEKGAHYGT